MHVWMVEVIPDYEQGYLQGIFSSKKKAEKVAKKIVSLDTVVVSKVKVDQGTGWYVSRET